MEFQGKLVNLLTIQSGTSKSGKAWQKQEFVVEEVGMQFPNSMCITAFGGLVGNLSIFKVGDLVKCQVNFKTNEWNGKYFNSINLWKIEPGVIRQQQMQPQPMPTQRYGQPAQPIQPPQGAYNQQGTYQQPQQQAQGQGDLPF